MKLLVNAILKFFCGLLLVGGLVFLPAGTVNYFNGWWLIGILFIPMLVLGTVLFCKTPDLLKKRLDMKEKEKVQKGVVALSALLFIICFVVAGLDFRFAWSSVPLWCSVIAAVVLLLSYLLYAEVMRENAYLSRTVKIEENQKLIDTGLYSVVRHPMYTSSVLMFLSMPIILGSWISFLLFLHYPIIIIVRIVNEEKLLEKELEGYTEYKQKVKYRLIPFIW